MDPLTSLVLELLARHVNVAETGNNSDNQPDDLKQIAGAKVVVEQIADETAEKMAITRDMPMALA